MPCPQLSTVKSKTENIFFTKRGKTFLSRYTRKHVSAAVYKPSYSQFGVKIPKFRLRGIATREISMTPTPKTSGMVQEFVTYLSHTPIYSRFSTKIVQCLRLWLWVEEFPFWKWISIGSVIPAGSPSFSGALTRAGLRHRPTRPWPRAPRF